MHTGANNLASQLAPGMKARGLGTDPVDTLAINYWFLAVRQARYEQQQLRFTAIVLILCMKVCIDLWKDM